MELKKKKLPEYSVTKKDNKKLAVDDFSRMLTLVEKYLKNIQANKNNNGKQKSLINDAELLELASALPAYAGMYDYGKITPPVYTIIDGGQNDDGRFTAASFMTDSGKIGLTREYVDKIKNGEFPFQEFANTIYHENQHFLNKYFIDRKFDNKHNNPNLERMYQNLVEANVNYSSSKRDAEQAMNTYICETGQDRLYFSDEFKASVEKVRALKKIDTSFECRIESQRYPEYLDLAVDLKNANIHIKNKLKTNPEFMRELKNAGIFVDELNSEKNDFSATVYNGFIQRCVDAYTEEPMKYGYLFSDASRLNFAVYSMNEDELSARRNSIVMQANMFRRLLGENLSEECLEMLEGEFKNDFEVEFARDLKETKGHKLYIENFNENVKSYLDNYEPSYKQRNYNNRILQDYATKNSSQKENVERLIACLTEGKGDYLHLIVNHLSMPEYLDEKEAERIDGLNSIFETLKAGELGDIDEKLAESFVFMFGKEKIFDLAKQYDEQGKIVYNAIFLKGIINSKQDVLPVDELLPEFAQATIDNNKQIDDIVLPELRSLTKKYKQDLSVIQRKQTLYAEDFSRALDIKKFAQMFAGNSKIEDEDLKREMMDIMAISFNTMNKYSGFFSEEELEMKENSIMQTYNIKMDDENFPLLLEAHANSYLSASIEYVERKKYGKAYAKCRRQERMGKFVDYTEKAMKNLKSKNAMEDSGERI